MKFCLKSWQLGWNVSELIVNLKLWTAGNLEEISNVRSDIKKDLLVYVAIRIVSQRLECVSWLLWKINLVSWIQRESLLEELTLSILLLVQLAWELKAVRMLNGFWLALVVVMNC